MNKREMFNKSVTAAKDWLLAQGYVLAETRHPTKSGYHMVAANDAGAIRIKVATAMRFKGKKPYVKQPSPRDISLGVRLLFVNPENGKVGFTQADLLDEGVPVSKTYRRRRQYNIS